MGWSSNQRIFIYTFKILSTFSVRNDFLDIFLIKSWEYNGQMDGLKSDMHDHPSKGYQISLWSTISSHFSKRKSKSLWLLFNKLGVV